MNKKTYKAKKIRNLHDLDLEQARVKQAYKHMEQNVLSSVITPDAVLSLVLNNIVASKNKKKAPRSVQQQKPRSLLSGLFAKKEKTTKASTEVIAALPRRKNKSYKKLGRSLIIWQTVSLALFIGINIFLYYKKRKDEIRNRD